MHSSGNACLLPAPRIALDFGHSVKLTKINLSLLTPIKMINVNIISLMKISVLSRYLLKKKSSTK